MRKPNIQGIKRILRSDRGSEILKRFFMFEVGVLLGVISLNTGSDSNIYLQRNYEILKLEQARNDPGNQQLVEKILKMEGLERVDAIKEAYRNAVINNPNIDEKYKSKVIKSFYPTIERFGLSPQMNKETLIEILAEAGTITYSEKPEELDITADADFTASKNEIRARNYQDEDANRHELDHAISKLFDTPGLREASNAFFTFDSSYEVLQRQFESLSFLIGFDNSLDLYLHGDETRLIRMFSEYTSQAKDFIEMMEEWRIANNRYIREVKNNQDTKSSSLQKEELNNRMSEIIKEAIKTKYGEEMAFNLSKVLRDYSAAGTTLSDIEAGEVSKSLIDNFYRIRKNALRTIINYCREKRSYELLQKRRCRRTKKTSCSIHS